MENKIIHFGAKEAFDHLENRKAVLLDIRIEYLHEFKQFAVPCSIHIPFEKLSEMIDELPKNLFFICADSSGINSQKAAKMLLDHGFETVGNLSGGMVDWERASLPTGINLTETLTGACMCQLKKKRKL
ncbi:MAG: rhodanese-like domain-containing protein [Bacteroidales bacterium]|nr:rhodanese-like domain-containing protein [Bacteroidales bacterium]